jgi:hypothetical protein
MGKNESLRTRTLCKDLETISCITFPIVAGAFAPPGWPDRYLHHKLWQGWIEFKIEGGDVTKLQRERIVQLNHRCPGSAFVVRHLFDGRLQIEDIDGMILKVIAGEDGQAFKFIMALSQLAFTMKEWCSHGVR